VSGVYVRRERRWVARTGTVTCRKSLPRGGHGGPGP
jgi:hypothetical protein